MNGLSDEIINLIEYLKNDTFVQGHFLFSSVFFLVVLSFVIFVFVKIFKDIFRGRK